eukprot:15364487-Ditylum_brightwellii.AAC.1
MEMMLDTEKKCQKPKKTGHMWSIKLVQAARVVRYWKTHKSDSFNKRKPSDNLLQLGKDLFIPYEEFPVDIIMSKLTAARKELRKVQKNAAELQDEYSEEMARLQITHNNTDIATIIRNL